MEKHRHITYCRIHKETLVVKESPSVLDNVLTTIINAVNNIEMRPLKSKKNQYYILFWVQNIIVSFLEEEKNPGQLNS